MIVFENVSKSFGSKVVLNQLDLKIPRGKITFVIGKSGEGKSVTIKHIIGLLKPDEGSVFVDGQNIGLLSLADMRKFRKKCSLLFQHAALFDSMTVEENIIFPLRESGFVSDQENFDLMQRVLSRVGLKGAESKFPSQLSTGEKKRVGLARALITKPKVILYDEPTTGMDPLICEMIDSLIVKVSEEESDLTSVVISHDLKAATAIADHIIMLYKGKVVQAGDVDSFIKTRNPVVQQFFSGKVEGPMEFF